LSYLLDTNVVSELRKGARCHAAVRRWFDSVESRELYLSVLVVGEIRCGIERLRPRDADRAEALERWLVDLVDHYGDRILAVDADVAATWGRINAPKSLPAIDSLMAPTALTHDLTMVTRKVQDMPAEHITVLDPFSTKPWP